MTAMTEFEATDLKADARRWVRKKRILYTILGIYGVLSIMWFGIDMADGTESIWFYWPMLGTGIAVAVTAVVIFGIGGLFGVGWEQRQIEHYLRQRGAQVRNGTSEESGTSP
jgi:TctA family transporter